MSFNIRYDAASDADRHGDNRWLVRRQRVADTIRNEQSDLVGLQEVLHHQLEWLREALPEFATLGVGRDDGETQGEYAPVFYRRDCLREVESGTFWFSEQPTTPGSRGWGATLPRICTWGRFVHSASSEAVFLYNLHLDHEAARARVESARLLSDRIQARSSADLVLVTGDFNALETDPPLVFLRSSASPVPLDTYRHRHQAADADGTYHDFSGIPEGRIDYILASPGCEILDAAIHRDPVGGGYPSDHFPITASLRVRPR